jgi:hypothetical protein
MPTTRWLSSRASTARLYDTDAGALCGSCATTSKAEFRGPGPAVEGDPWRLLTVRSDAKRRLDPRILPVQLRSCQPADGCLGTAPTDRSHRGMTGRLESMAEVTIRES